MLARLRERSDAENGFTLIELLVVMIIIAILMAVAVPTFLSQKNTAVKTKATANIKQVVNAIESCATQLPSGGYTDATAGGLNCLTPATLVALEPALKSLGTIGTASAAPAANQYTVVPVGSQGYAVAATIVDAGDNMTFIEHHSSTGELYKLCGRNMAPTATTSGPVTGSKTCLTGKW
ncbi:prepilin-type N-terminal cleavage/methylation domain-containing protein [Aeromicrobium sp.]|uniref:prepilin-type N-terminal cleavage/methylation domain-containing protein n=1 Tax=Aeromicrobium sp. TaxID=1871063 RepID=UPI0019A4DEF3|nr:prepilin-type N-terminal cleavage/methylation domain-containing protein [Aeromicrobium sp.]MBC7631924.1 prepilin-type N-terminal cleavage/methylation domain-containing protein [Aeromicrobium sp.]